MTDFRATASCIPWHSSGIRHDRIFERRGRLVRITDSVIGATGRRAESFLHFHHDCTVTRLSPTSFEAQSGDRLVSIKVEGALEVSLHRGERAPVIGWRAVRFGDVVPAWSIRMRLPDGADARAVLTPV